MNTYNAVNTKTKHASAIILPSLDSDSSAKYTVTSECIHCTCMKVLFVNFRSVIKLTCGLFPNFKSEMFCYFDLPACNTSFKFKTLTFFFKMSSLKTRWQLSDMPIKSFRISKGRFTRRFWTFSLFFYGFMGCLWANTVDDITLAISMFVLIVSNIRPV